MTTNELIEYGGFALLALITLVGALKVATTRSIMHAAFWLFPVFAGIAGFYLYLGAQFLAAIQVLIYIGAILVLIVFAVTLTRNPMDHAEGQNNRFTAPVALAGIAMLLALLAALAQASWPRMLETVDGVLLAPGLAVVDVQAIGRVLLQQYLLPFEIASVLLLAAMIGAIVMARRERMAPETFDCADAPAPVEMESDETVQV